MLIHRPCLERSIGGTCTNESVFQRIRNSDEIAEAAREEVAAYQVSRKITTAPGSEIMRMGGAGFFKLVVESCWRFSIAVDLAGDCAAPVSLYGARKRAFVKIGAGGAEGDGAASVTGWAYDTCGVAGTVVSGVGPMVISIVGFLAGYQSSPRNSGDR